VKTRNAYISVSGANPGHSASWPAITPATNVPCPRLSFKVPSLVQFVRSYKINLTSQELTMVGGGGGTMGYDIQENNANLCLFCSKVCYLIWVTLAYFRKR
jgi:hypothetical protein